MASTCPEFKVILCGEFGVGKTSLFRRFSSDIFIDTSGMSASESRQSTLGLDHFTRKFENSKVLNEKSLKIQLWDTGGLERMGTMTHNYYKFAEAALLVFALNSLDSFNCLSQHLVEILSKAENAKIFLVGNKCDLDRHEVSDQMVDQFIDQFSLEQFPKFNGYFKTSCKTNQGVNQMFEEISKILSSSSYSFKDTFDTFTLHGHHPPGLGMPCCTPGSNVPHSHHNSTNDDGTSSFSCCAK